MTEEEGEVETKPEIRNIVITCDIGPPQTTNINLVDLSKRWKCRGAQMNKKKFPNLVIPMRQPKCTVLVFRYGTIVAQGCKYVYEGVDVLLYVCRMIRRDCLPTARCSRMIIQNVVAERKFAFCVNLQRIFEHNPIHDTGEGKSLSEYSDIQTTFPGAVIKKLPALRGTTVLLFWTGAGIVTGGKSTRQVREVAEVLRELVWPFRMLPGEDKDSILEKTVQLGRKSCHIPSKRRDRRGQPFTKRRLSKKQKLPELSAAKQQTKPILFE